MSNKKQGSMSKLPKGYTEKSINEASDEAYRKGVMEVVDVIGNTTPFTEKEDILYEMFTGEEKPLAVKRVLGVIKHLQGKVLTVIDATFLDEARAKFVKDLVKDQFSQSSNWIFEMSIRDFEESKE